MVSFGEHREEETVVARDGRRGMRGDVRILSLKGEFDAADVPGVTARLDAALSGGAARVVVNLSQVDFVSAAVLGCLLAGRARARRRAGDLVLSGPSRFARRMLRTLRLDGIVDVFRGDADAVRHLLTLGIHRPHVSIERVRGSARRLPRSLGRKLPRLG
jgi:anti-sigma B factor antagonist